MKSEILRFEPNVHTALWGDERWLVSAHLSSPSRLVGGERTFSELCPNFPLLVKIIRAERRLSVQVHPNDVTAKTVGGEAKTEMWCVLKAGPIFAGFRPGVTASDVERAVADGSFEEMLVRFDAQPGECYFIPGGLVHAIGEGTTVYEVQQSSDTTFRLYDWGRVGADGRPRQLHVREGIAAMDISLPPPVPSKFVLSPYFEFHEAMPGAVAPSDDWRVFYLPDQDDSFVLPAGVSVELGVRSFVTVVKGFRT